MSLLLPPPYYIYTCRMVKAITQQVSLESATYPTHPKDRKLVPIELLVK